MFQRKQNTGHTAVSPVGTSVAVVAEISLRSPQKSVGFTVKTYNYRIKVSKQKIILNKASLVGTHR